MPSPKPTFYKIRAMFKKEYGTDPGEPQSLVENIKQRIAKLVVGG